MLTFGVVLSKSRFKFDNPEFRLIKVMGSAVHLNELLKLCSLDVVMHRCAIVGSGCS